jgi:hypothetical protein
VARTVLSRLVLACALAAPGAANAHAQRPAVLRGSVLKDADDAPIPGAEVAIPRLGIGVLSDSAGNFRLNAIVLGQQIVWVRKIGFAPVSAVLTFASGDTLERDFAMAIVAQTLPGVSVTAPPPVPPKLSEFEERRKEGFGHFITPEMFEKHENRQLSEIMSLISGPTVVRGTTNAAWIASVRGPQTPYQAGAFGLTEMDKRRGAKGNMCYASVVLDGAFVFQGMPGEALFDINSLPTTDIAGIEYYSGGSTMPVKYNGTRNTCGLLVIWTK